MPLRRFWDLTLLCEALQKEQRSLLAVVTQPLASCTGALQSMAHSVPRKRSRQVEPVPWQTLTFLILRSSPILLIHAHGLPSQVKLDSDAVQGTGIAEDAQPPSWHSQPQQAPMTMHIDLEALAASRTACSKPAETGTTAYFSAATLQVCMGSHAVSCTQKVHAFA